MTPWKQAQHHIDNLREAREWMREIKTHKTQYREWAIEELNEALEDFVIVRDNLPGEST